MPSDTKAAKGKSPSLVRPKWGGRAALGVFAGYVMSPTGIWTGRYLVWDLDMFVGLDLTAKASANSKEARALRSPHETMRVDVKDFGCVCSLCETGINGLTRQSKARNASTK